MKILHITTFTTGGAGIACMRLHQQLRKNGIDSKVLSFDTSLHNDVDIFDYKKLIESSTYNQLQFRLNQSIQWRYTNSLLKGKSKKFDFFSLPYIYNNLRKIKIVQEADIIHLHWIANFINYAELPFLDKKIVWTLHDMNPITGGCHYSYDCNKFTIGCNNCPQLSGTKNPDAVKYIFDLKKNSYENLNIKFVAPSQWILNRIRESKITSKIPATYINHGIDISVFKPNDKSELRKKLNLPLDKKIVLYVSDDLANRRKGLYRLNEIIDESNPEVIFCCIGKNLKKLPLDKTHYLGYFKDEQQIASIYSAVDLFIIPSVEDNLPNTVLESLACGTPVIGFNSGGIPEMIENGKNGFIVEKDDTVAMKNKIYEIINDELLLDSLGKYSRENVINRFEIQKQTLKYIDIYNESPKIKALHINTNDVTGGAALMAFELTHKLKADCYLAVQQKESNSPKSITLPRNSLDKLLLLLDKFIWKIGIRKELRNIFSLSSELNFTFKKLKSMHEYRNADIIHLHNIHGNYFDLSALKKIASEKPIIWTLQDMWAITGGEAHTFGNENYKKGIAKTPYNNIYPLKSNLIDRRQYYMDYKKIMYKEIGNRLTLVPVSRWLEQCVINSYVYNQEIKVKLIHNGVNTDIFKNQNKRNWTKPRVLFFNIPNPFKGIELFTSILEHINTDFDLYIVGEPLEGHPIHKRMSYVIDREELNLLYNNVDILIFPSLAESMGMTVIEAMACGVCVIASDVGGIPDMLNQDCGYLFKTGDKNDLLEKINSALANLNDSRNKGQKASGNAQSFSLENKCEIYLDLYNEILNSEKNYVQ